MKKSALLFALVLVSGFALVSSAYSEDSKKPPTQTAKPPTQGMKPSAGKSQSQDQKVGSDKSTKGAAPPPPDAAAAGASTVGGFVGGLIGGAINTMAPPR